MIARAWRTAQDELELEIQELEIPSRTLLVVAHPDDEYYCAAALFRLARECGHVVDQAIVTDGAGGHKFAMLAEAIYGTQISALNLPRIRREEARRAAGLLGIRKQWFLEEADPGFTLEAEEAFACWNVRRIEDRLVEVMVEEEYEQVLILLPRESEHGHHQAIAQIVERAVGRLPEGERPALWGVEPGVRGEEPEDFAAALRHRHFRRDVATAADLRVPYQVVVNWVIAEHKSQGLFQLEAGRHDVERFWLLREGERERGAFELALF